MRARCLPLLVGHQSSLEQVAEQIGLEVTLQAVKDPQEGFGVAPEDPIPVLELENPIPVDPPGRASAGFGAAAVEAVLRAGTMCKEGSADGMVTPPLNKRSMHMAGFQFEGQTQILGELSGSRRYGMLACSGDLRILVATRHMALRKALERLDVGAVTKQLRIAHEAARGPLGLTQPRIALAGLNPHASEGGAFGDEEKKILVPAIKRVEDEFGWSTYGPEVPDVVFAEGAAGQWDVVVALYHDQAFIPLKFAGRAQAWTLFVGGGILRTSPMHGTAYDIARTGAAETESFRFAFEQCLRLAEARISASCSNSSTKETKTSSST